MRKYEEGGGRSAWLEMSEQQRHLEADQGDGEEDAGEDPAMSPLLLDLLGLVLDPAFEAVELGSG